jgi:hypothetical protein
MILKETSELKTPKEKAEYLKKHESEQLKGVLKVMFDKNIKLALPEGSPPYKPNQFDEESEERLYLEWRKMYLFIEGMAPNVRRMQREHAFIEMLESIHSEDAKLMVAMKDKVAPYDGITPAVIKKAFPGLL